jgi:hypothetical protein
VAGLAGAIGTGYLIHGVTDVGVAAALFATSSTMSPWLLGALMVVPRFTATLLSAALKIWVAVAIDRLSPLTLLGLAVVGSTGLLLSPLGGALSSYATTTAMSNAGVATIVQWQQLVAAASMFTWIERLTLVGVLLYSFLRSR